MRAWQSPDVPSLEKFGPGPAVSILNTASGKVEETRPNGTARMYVCGITPYDATHMGHAATYVAFDLLNRAWRDAGHQVRYVQNVTDIDDPLLERAAATGADWREIAVEQTELFRADMETLRSLTPDAYIGAVESIPLAVALIQRLRERGFVYEVEGDLYFSAHADPGFGRVSRLNEQQMIEIFPDRGGDPDRPGKKHPLDWLLWRVERPGEPAWDSELGRGRPGWHIECSSIALNYLGETFDVQGGGSDLVFPHHEMSASEAQSASGGTPFAKGYMHAGMVAFEGEKMSKSRGNLVFVSRLRESGTDPMAIRLALLGHHYRSDWEWTDADLTRAELRLATWRAAADRACADDAARLVSVVRRHLADDLDAPAALKAIDEWATSAEGEGQGCADVCDLLDARLGIRL
ncbi:MAG TPA: cysteine--1-D-myo-inosityl 2-amino-2-deoxy-alpha-D-glucopyranoside ligase [Nocardioidaceae bacterium]